MVFSSVPVYLDPPNWQQQQPNHDHHQQQQGGRADHHHHQNTQLPPPPPPPQQPNQVGGGGTGSIRPGSMADRARMAKLPQPETALKCPRCDSANTKFCYFNNYSLSQPRHFCKTCRRYWTRGGALRNVPVGGGCRRNKRSKSSSRSKSPGSAAAASSDRQTGACASTSAATMSSNGGDILGHLAPPPHLPFLPALHHLGTDHYGAGSSDIGLNFGGIPLPQVMATGGGGGSGTDVEYLPTGLAEQWRLQQQVQQFPFLANLEAPPNTGSGLYPFDHHHHHHHHHQHQHQNHHENVEPPGYGRSKPLDSGVSGVVSQMASVKVEGLSNNNNNNNQGLNIMSRNFLGALGNHNDHQYNLGGGTGTAAANNAWTDLSTFSTTSSTNHLL